MENDHVCRQRHCDGIVRLYHEDGGVREPTPEIVKNELSKHQLVIRWLKKKLRLDYQKIEWYECTVCNTYHDESEV